MQILKKIVFTAFITIFLLLSVSYAADVAKIGIINSQKILMNSDGGKSIQAEINRQGKKMEEDLKKKGAEIENLKKEIERESMVLSKEMREEKGREIRIKINDIKSTQKKFRSDLKEIEKKLLLKIRNEILKITEDIGKKEGYLLIIENVGVLYAPQSIDITDQIIKEYNIQLAKKNKKPDDKKKE